MGKKVSGKRGRSSADGEVWGASDHAIRRAKQQRKQEHHHHHQNNEQQEEKIVEKQLKQQHRTALLTRDSKEKREAGKLRLHIKRVQRIIEKLRSRLEQWDDEEEKKRKKQEREEERKRLEEEQDPTKKKKKGRKGPETWKLKGPARPAWQVYDFDTRYVDPHIKAHEEAKRKAQRVRNIFTIFKGRFGEDDGDIPQPQCREFLSLLMQLGNLCMEARQLKSARQAFIECMDLDSKDNPITPARCQLMRLYMDANRPDSARRLWESLPNEEVSVWIRYSAALVEYVSWKVLNEEGSSEAKADALLAQAVKSNIFCAYYLAFNETFDKVIDYADEIEGANEESPLEEAIEYCNSEQRGAWEGTPGAIDWVRNTLLRANRRADNSVESLLTTSDLKWRDLLNDIKESHEPNKESMHGDENENDSDRDDEEHSKESNNDGDGDNSDEEADEEGSEVDVVMYAGMFETAMEMLEEAGELR